MRSDKKDYQLLAEAYATVQEQEQLDEFAGFGTGGMGDKFLRSMPGRALSKVLPGNMAGKASARVDTASFVKQNIQPVFDQLTQSLGERDQVDLGQVADIVGNAYGVDPDSLKAFSKYQQNGQITGTLPVAQARDLLFTAASDATGVAASKRYAQRQGGAGGYTPVNQQQQQTVPQQNQQQQQTVPQQNQQQPGPDENGAWAQPKDGIARTVGKFGLNAARKIGGAALNKMRDFNADMKADAQKATDDTNAAKAKEQEQKERDEYAAIMSVQDNKSDGGQANGTPPPPPPPPPPEDVANPTFPTNPSQPEAPMPGMKPPPPPVQPPPEAIDSEAEELEVVDNETPPEDNYNVVSGSDGSTTLGTQVDASENPQQQQQQQQVGNKNEIEPSVITPPAPPQNPQLPNNPEEDEEEDPNKKQLPTLREQYIRPLGGCGFMRDNWGNFNK